MPGVEEITSAFDMFEPFKDMRDAYLDSMSKMMTDAVNTESYAQATGTMLDYYLAISAPFREAAEKSLLQALQQLSLPSREEFALLAERFTNLEMIVDDLDKKLDRISSRVSDEQKQLAGVPERLEARLDSLNESLRKISESVSALVVEKQKKPVEINSAPVVEKQSEPAEPVVEKQRKATAIKATPKAK
jgi:hypothetical protein